MDSGPHADLYVRERSFSSSSWTSSHILLQNISNPANLLSAANTNDGKSHIVYEITGGVGYRSYDGSWSNEEEIGSGYNSPRIYSVSNDLFVVWGKDWPAQNRYIHYRQYDAAPLTPQNLSIYVPPDGYTTTLSWTANSEPDVKTGGKYKIYRAQTSGGEPTSFDLVATINAYNGNTPVTSWIDEDAGKSVSSKLFYKISALDCNFHESPLSPYVWRYGRIPKQAFGNQTAGYNFTLMENYPNPFNPSTKIAYSLAEDSKVQIKVYDMLGIEVAELVNETKSAGFYEATFDASNLSSGIYIYRITALKGDRILFNESKRMILMK